MKMIMLTGAEIQKTQPLLSADEKAIVNRNIAGHVICPRAIYVADNDETAPIIEKLEAALGRTFVRAQ